MPDKTRNPGHYCAPKWLRGAHSQTIFPFLFLSQKIVHYERQEIEAPDGDFLHIDWINNDRNLPLVVVLHGLEGSSKSHYSKALMQHVKTVGWSGCVVHFRGCSGVPNRLPRAYHSGDSNELEWLIALLRKLNYEKIFIVGYSLGGNVLLNWLGQSKYLHNESISAAASISAPYDLTVAGNRLSVGINKIYGNHFLRTLKVKAIRKIQDHKLNMAIESIKNCETLKQFDNHFTAPLHGYADVNDYWSRASSKPFLSCIKKPTMIIHAENDPFIPGVALKTLTQNNGNIMLNLTTRGGHVGYTSGSFPGHIGWLPNQIIQYFKEFL
ncbi:hydrolase [Burkholderiales bacterium]|nr:hydrolase [Burkholderiales bacterium]